MTQANTQTAPYPHELADLVAKCTYRQHEGWRLALKDTDRDSDADGHVIGRGLTLQVLTMGYDAYHPKRGIGYGVYHYFIVPAATYNRAAWQRWLFEQLLKVETHECMENFVVDGQRPFAPLHGKGDDPYVVHELASDAQRGTRFTDMSPAT